MIRAWCVKGADGKLVHCEPDETEQYTWDTFCDATRKSVRQWKAEGYTCVPVEIYEAGEPKAVAIVYCADPIPEGTHGRWMSWLVNPIGLENGTKLYTHPPGTLALLREWLHITRNDVGIEFLREATNAWLKEHGHD
jgi:hypothetical protein